MFLLDLTIILLWDHGGDLGCGGWQFCDTLFRWCRLGGPHTHQQYVCERMRACSALVAGAGAQRTCGGLVAAGWPRLLAGRRGQDKATALACAWCCWVAAAGQLVSWSWGAGRLEEWILVPIRF